MLVGTKADLDRKIITEEAQEKARKYNVAYIETSALSGDRVEDAFFFAVNSTINSIHENINEIKFSHYKNKLISMG